MEITKEKIQTTELCSVCFGTGYLDDGEICGACDDEGHIKPAERFTFNEEEHVYTLDGKPLYGTTTVLGVIAKPMLIGWAASMTADYIRENVAYAIPGEDGGYWAIKPKTVEEAKSAHRKKKEKAGELGTDVHKEIEEWIKTCIKLHDGLPVVTGTSSPQATEFIQWAVVKNVKFLASEKRLYSEEWWVGGTADFICEMEGKILIGDVKTGKDIYQEFWYQTGAYAKMTEEMGLYPKIEGLVVVNVPKAGGLKIEFNYDIEGNKKAFECALYLYKKGKK